MVACGHTAASQLPMVGDTWVAIHTGDSRLTGFCLHNKLFDQMTLKVTRIYFGSWF